jgi:hypothetical protein
MFNIQSFRNPHLLKSNPASVASNGIELSATERSRDLLSNDFNFDNHHNLQERYGIQDDYRMLMMRQRQSIALHEMDHPLALNDFLEKSINTSLQDTRETTSAASSSLQNSVIALENLVSTDFLRRSEAITKSLELHQFTAQFNSGDQQQIQSLKRPEGQHSFLQPQQALPITHDGRNVLNSPKYAQIPEVCLENANLNLPTTMRNVPGPIPGSIAQAEERITTATMISQNNYIMMENKVDSVIEHEASYISSQNGKRNALASDDLCMSNNDAESISHDSCHDMIDFLHDVDL